MQGDSFATSKHLATVLCGNESAARLLADIIHTDIVLESDETQALEDQLDFELPLTDLAIWIDPIGKCPPGSGGGGGGSLSKGVLPRLSNPDPIYDKNVRVGIHLSISFLSDARMDGSRACRKCRGKDFLVTEGHSCICTLSMTALSQKPIPCL